MTGGWVRQWRFTAAADRLASEPFYPLSRVAARPVASAQHTAVAQLKRLDRPHYRDTGPGVVVSESVVASALVPPAHSAPNSGVVSGLFLYLAMNADSPGSSARSNVSW